MKRHLPLILLFCVSALTVNAQTAHNLLTTVDAGVAALWQDNQNPIGGGGGIGIGYEMRKQHFLFSAAAEVKMAFAASETTYQGAMQVLDDNDLASLQPYDNLYQSAIEQTDDLHYALYSARLPLLFGYTNGKMYLKAGVEVGYSFAATCKLQTTSVETITYNAFAEDFNTHPKIEQHRTATEDSRPNIPNTLLLAPTIEIGWQKELNKRTSLRVAAFADYGFHLSHSAMYAPKSSLEAGIRLSLLLQMRQRQQCRCEEM